MLRFVSFVNRLNDKMASVLFRAFSGGLARDAGRGGRGGGGQMPPQRTPKRGAPKHLPAQFQTSPNIILIHI